MVTKLSSLDYVLYRTHKSVLEACDELMLKYSLEIGNTLTVIQCNSCGVWLKPQQLKKDLDGLDICTTCLDAYGA